mgnify:CR=1 FL=1
MKTNNFDQATQAQDYINAGSVITNAKRSKKSKGNGFKYVASAGVGMVIGAVAATGATGITRAIGVLRPAPRVTPQDVADVLHENNEQNVTIENVTPEDVAAELNQEIAEENAEQNAEQSTDETPVVEENTAEGVTVEEMTPEMVAAELNQEIAEENAVVDETAVVEEAPIVEETAVVEEAPIVEEAAVVEENAVVEEAPIVEENAVVEEAPIVEETAVVEEAPIVEETAVVEEAPIVEEVDANNVVEETTSDLTFDQMDGQTITIGDVAITIDGDNLEQIENIESPESMETISLASVVSDDMSFTEAFAAARSEVGANGVFEWRGGVYGTYYSEEWSELSDEFKSEFQNHDWRSDFEAGLEEVALGEQIDDTTENDLSDVDNEDIAENTDEVVGSFGDYDIMEDENGEQYIVMEDCLTGEEVRVSPDDLHRAILDTNGNFMGIVSEEAIAQAMQVEEPVLMFSEDGTYDLVDAAETDISDMFYTAAFDSVADVSNGDNFEGVELADVDSNVQSLDDTYVLGDDPNVEIDYDSEETIDVELLAQKAESLLACQRTELPRFDFKTGKRTIGQVIEPTPDDVAKWGNTINNAIYISSEVYYK